MKVYILNRTTDNSDEVLGAFYSKEDAIASIPKPFKNGELKYFEMENISTGYKIEEYELSKNPLNIRLLTVEQMMMEED